MKFIPDRPICLHMAHIHYGTLGIKATPRNITDTIRQMISGSEARSHFSPADCTPAKQLGNETPAARLPGSHFKAGVTRFSPGGMGGLAAISF